MTIAGESHLVAGQPQPQLHILSERRPDDPPGLKTHYLQDHDQAQLLFLQQEDLERMGDNNLVEAGDTKMTGSEFDDEDQASSSMMPFSELLSDPEKDEGQDPPSSTTGDSGEKPSKRAAQGKEETLRCSRMFAAHHFGLSSGGLASLISLSLLL